jgi:hypothetical protein
MKLGCSNPCEIGKGQDEVLRERRNAEGNSLKEPHRKLETGLEHNTNVVLDFSNQGNIWKDKKKLSSKNRLYINIEETTR